MECELTLIFFNTQDMKGRLVNSGQSYRLFDESGQRIAAVMHDGARPTFYGAKFGLSKENCEQFFMVGCYNCQNGCPVCGGYGWTWSPETEVDVEICCHVALSDEIKHSFQEGSEILTNTGFPFLLDGRANLRKLK